MPDGRMRGATARPSVARQWPEGPGGFRSCGPCAPRPPRRASPPRSARERVSHGGRQRAGRCRDAAGHGSLDRGRSPDAPPGRPRTRPTKPCSARGSKPASHHSSRIRSVPDRRSMRGSIRPTKPVAVQDREHVVPPAPLGRGDVHLPDVVESRTGGAGDRGPSTADRAARGTRRRAPAPPGVVPVIAPRRSARSRIAISSPTMNRPAGSPPTSTGIKAPGRDAARARTAAAIRRVMPVPARPTAPGCPTPRSRPLPR